jgi:SIT family siderophore-iron:H+ symporter-like MFS transporter
VRCSAHSQINAWVAGNVAAAVLGVTTWRWGIGMWALIYPVCTLPLLFALWWSHRKASRQGALAKHASAYDQLGLGRLTVALFWQLDVIGIILVIAVFALILVPFTIAGSTPEQWKSGHIIAMLVIGFCCLPVFIWWESRAQHPLVPFHLLRDRGAWAALGMAPFLNFAWYLQGEFVSSFYAIFPP